MKIKSNVLRSLKIFYQLQVEIEAANCNQEEIIEICEFILGDAELYETFASTPFLIEFLLNLCKNAEFEEKLFRVILERSSQGIQCFRNFSLFKEIFKLFIHKDLSAAVKLRRGRELLNQSINTPAFEYLKRGTYALAEFVAVDQDLDELVFSWAEQNMLIDAAGIAAMKKSIEEQKRKAEAENAVEMMRGKLARRNNYPMMFPNNPSSTALHHLAGSVWCSESDTHKAITLLRNGAALEARDQFGDTPLISAAMAGNMMMTLLLVSWGARVAVVDEDGYMPKYYKQFYSCDHEYDEGGCIPLKRYMDDSRRNFLSKIEVLEKTHLPAGENLYSFDKIKADLLALMVDKEFQDPKPLAALCGYIFNHVVSDEQQAVCQFFMDNCKIDLTKEQELQSSYGHVYAALQKPVRSPVLSNLASQREQLYVGRGNKNISTIIEDMLGRPNLVLK